MYSFYSGLTLNQYSVASPCRTICTVCGFVALSWFKVNPLYIVLKTDFIIVLPKRRLSARNEIATHFIHKKQLFHPSGSHPRFSDDLAL